MERGICSRCSVNWLRVSGFRLQGTGYRLQVSGYKFQGASCRVGSISHFLRCQLSAFSQSILTKSYSLFTTHYSHSLTTHLSLRETINDKRETTNFSLLIHYLISATAAGKSFRLGFKSKPHPQYITHCFAQGFITFKMGIGVYVGMHFHVNIKHGKQIA